MCSTQGFFIGLRCSHPLQWNIHRTAWSLHPADHIPLNVVQALPDVCDLKDVISPGLASLPVSSVIVTSRLGLLLKFMLLFPSLRAFSSDSTLLSNCPKHYALASLLARNELLVHNAGRDIFNNFSSITGQRCLIFLFSTFDAPVFMTVC